MKHHKTPRWAAVARALRPRDLIHRERYSADPQYRKMWDRRKVLLDDVVAHFEKAFWKMGILKAGSGKPWGLEFWIKTPEPEDQRNLFSEVT